jgi:hypothetical protein
MDFISVIVICSIVVFCFVICLVIGCKRRKQRQRRAARFEDLVATADQSHSVTETDGPTRSVTNAERSTGDSRSPNSLRRTCDSPPPTYSIIERQTSFTSHISQTSSMIEVPPDYDEAWDLDKSGAEEPSQQPMLHSASGRARRSLRNGSSHNERLETGPGSHPPRARNYRSHSDVADARRRPRRRISSRPSTVSEDDVTSEANTTARSIDVIAEVTPRSSAVIESPPSLLAESIVSSASSRPLLDEPKKLSEHRAPLTTSID